jgi:integrase
VVPVVEDDRAIWATAMYAGLRLGELRAPRVEDVDLARVVIHVARGWDPSAGAIAEVAGRAAQDADRRRPTPGATRSPR